MTPGTERIESVDDIVMLSNKIPKNQAYSFKRKGSARVFLPSPQIFQIIILEAYAMNEDREQYG
jgi:hypothetical protein